MIDILMICLVVFLAFVTGYVTRDYQRFSRQYDLEQYQRAQARVAALQEPENGPWSNVRAIR